MLETIRRTLTFTWAPIFKNFNLMLWHVASAILVPRSPTERSSLSTRKPARKTRGVAHGPHGRRTGPVGEQIQLLLLDAVLHLPAGAVQLLVEFLRLVFLPGKVGHDEARVLPLVHVLGFAHDTSRARPTVARSIRELNETPGRATRVGPVASCLFHRVGDALQKTPVFRQSEEVFHPVGLAPAHQSISAKAAIGPNKDLCQGPSMADQLHQALQYFLGPVAGVDIGFPRCAHRR